MVDLIRRLLSPEYWVVSDPGPMGALGALYAFLGLGFLVGLVWALRSLQALGRTDQPSTGRTLAWLELWLCTAGLGTVVGRFLAWPGWSARIWPALLATLAATVVVIARFRAKTLPPWLWAQLRILALRPPAPTGAPTQGPSGRAWWMAGLAVHWLGIALVVAAYGWPVWLAIPVLAALLAPQALAPRRPAPIATSAESDDPPQAPTASLSVGAEALMALTPLLVAYLATALRLFYLGQGITVIGWQGLVFPNPMVSLFYLDGVVLAAVSYTLLCQWSVASGRLGRRDRFWQGALIALLVATLAWSGAIYFGKRTHGATASDPFAYAQMGVDLVERGTFLHRYSLFQEVMPLQIAWAPLQPVGYHIPRNELGDCPSVWATGASVLLAAGYKLAGEAGLYLATPVVALLALVATWFLVQETLRGQPRPIRHLTAALAVALTATSPEHVDRLLVPMADAPAQLFTALALLFALRAMRQLSGGGRALWASAWAGLFFAWAYWVRHTQLVLALPLALALLLGAQADQTAAPSTRRKRAIVALVVVGMAALVGAAPDIAYRWQVFGGPLATETTELPLMHPKYMGPVAWQMLRDSLVAGEWGYLFPLALFGGYRLARDRSREAWVLGSAFLLALLVHLTYHSLRLRDLISLFPLVNLAVGYGAVALVVEARRLAQKADPLPRLGPALLPALLIGWTLLSLAMARWAMIDNLWKPGWASFGYMRADHRRAFDRLAELTPPQAIIGASLNAGAVMMYTDRDAIRPYDSWTEDEWTLFLEAMRRAARPVYLVDDGGLMAEFIDRQGARHTLTPIEELSLPLFYTRDRDTGWLYRLEWEP